MVNPYVANVFFYPYRVSAIWRGWARFFDIFNMNVSYNDVLGIPYVYTQLVECSATAYTNKCHIRDVF